MIESTSEEYAKIKISGIEPLPTQNLGQHPKSKNITLRRKKSDHARYISKLKRQNFISEGKR